MNGNLLAFGTVAALAVGAAASCRGSRGGSRGTLLQVCETHFHVTNRKNVRDIRRRGFRGTDGICGFGVYLWDDIFEAEQMLFDVDDGVILAIDPGESFVDACDTRDTESEGDSSYYEHVGIVRVKPGQRWIPRSIRVHA